MRRSKVLALAATADWLVCSSNDGDGRLRVMRRQTGEVIFEKELQSYADAIGLSADGSAAIVGDRNGEILLFDVPQLMLRHSVRAHSDGLTAIARSDSELFITGGRDQMLRLWRLTSGRLEPVAAWGPFSNAIKQVLSSADGRAVAVLVAREQAVRFLQFDELRRRLQTLELNWP
jgi:WD40 repeat protein